MFGADHPVVLQAARRLGVAEKLASVHGLVEQRLLAAAGAPDIDEQRVAAAAANWGAFVQYATTALK